MKLDDASRAQLELEIRELCTRGDHAAAATRLMRGYGPEIFGFLVAVHRSESDAGESFSDFAEAAWRNLPGFAWESSARTWAYAIARNVTRTRKRNAARRQRREVHAQPAPTTIASKSNVTSQLMGIAPAPRQVYEARLPRPQDASLSR